MKRLFRAVSRTYVSSGSSSWVRLRFAPSPTGNLHLGGLRTALYNYLMAKSLGGSFVLRIEDTDRTRLVPGAVEKLREILDWAGLAPDEGPFQGGDFGPYVQSQRLDTYREHAQKILRDGRAYRCFCSERRLDVLRRDAAKRGQVPKYDNRCRKLSPAAVQEKLGRNEPHVVRLKLDSFPFRFEDLVFGPIAHDPTASEGDPIVMKSDGFPTYHFANVVDDHLMEITHVVRGAEWLVSTPKHKLLYEALGWDPPRFAHLPLVVNSDGTKLSKRQGDLSVEHFKERGYFPEAILNFVIQIGGGFGRTEGLRLLDLPEMISKFSLDKINVNSCRMQLSKLDDCNRMAIANRLANDDVAAASLITTTKRLVLDKFGNSLGERGRVNLTDTYVEKVLRLFQSRIDSIDELVADDLAYVWILPERMDKLLSESLPHGDIPGIIEALEGISHDSFRRDDLNVAFKTFARDKSVKYGQLMKMLRLAITDQSSGPSVAEMLEVLGKDLSIQRLRHARRLL